MALNKAFAENGDKVKISENKTDNGVLNYDEGFGQRYEQPIKAVIDEKGNITSTGGLQITRPQFNGLMNDITTAIIENQNAILANQQAIQENLAKIEALRAYADDRFSGCAGLDLPNIFSQLNQFKGGIEASNAVFSSTTSIINPTLWKDLKDNDVPTKRQILDNVSFDSAVASGLAYVNKQNVFTQPQMYDSAVTSNIVLPNDAFLPKSALGETDWDKNVALSLRKFFFKKGYVTLANTGNSDRDFDDIEKMLLYLSQNKILTDNALLIDASNYKGPYVTIRDPNLKLKILNINLDDTYNDGSKIIIYENIWINGGSLTGTKDFYCFGEFYLYETTLNAPIICNSGVGTLAKCVHNRHVGSYGSIVAAYLISSTSSLSVSNYYFQAYAGGVFASFPTNLVNVTNKCNLAKNTITNQGFFYSN